MNHAPQPNESMSSSPFSFTLCQFDEVFSSNSMDTLKFHTANGYTCKRAVEILIFPIFDEGQKRN